jgi:hypothetical protein
MKIWQKVTLALLAAAGFTAAAGVLWFLSLLMTSPSEPDGFSQDHQEQWAVASCWRQIRDGQITDTSQCSEYAQAHLDFFTEQLAPTAAATTCNLSRAHLAYAQRYSPQSRRLLEQLHEEVEADCNPRT